MDPHVHYIRSGANARTSGDDDRPPDSDSDVESGESSDSSGKGSNFSEGSRLSDGEDEDIPDDDPEWEEEARAVYSRELREGDASTAKGLPIR